MGVVKGFYKALGPGGSKALFYLYASTYTDSPRVVRYSWYHVPLTA